MAKLDVSELLAVQETLLIPLWARARETRRAEPILCDRRACELVESLDYDFAKFDRAKVDQVGFCSRAAIIDTLVREQLERHPQTTVVEIGPGLDTRFDRLNNDSVRWFELDLPAAMEVRRALFSETPRRTLMGASVLDSDWLQRVKQEQPKHVMLVAEGVFFFFSEQQLRSLLATLAEHFPGAHLIFDSVSPLYLRYVNFRHPLRDSRMIWSIRNIREIEKWDGHWTVEKSVGFGDRPYYNRQLRRFPWLYRAARRICPPVRRMFQIHVLRTSPARS
jgi:O-methyltransferase involved in polyketide biosynthesis